jgi:hypothetical protein
MIAADISRALDASLALGLPAFPCRRDKASACPRGFLAARDEPAAIRELWQRHPGSLVGVPTGADSNIGVFDLDSKHPEAVAWWSKNRHRLPRTRVHRTRSGGLHLVFRHLPNMRCWTGRPVPGIDGRGDGGYVIWWPAAGLPVWCDAPTAMWPEWLLIELQPPPSTARSTYDPMPPMPDAVRRRELPSPILARSRAWSGGLPVHLRASGTRSPFGRPVGRARWRHPGCSEPRPPLPLSLSSDAVQSAAGGGGAHGS